MIALTLFMVKLILATVLAVVLLGTGCYVALIIITLIIYPIWALWCLIAQMFD